MRKVSFDFDGTLSNLSVQKYAKKLIEQGIDVHIVTSRWEDPSLYIDLKEDERNHDDLFSVMEKLRIKRENLHFTNMEYKIDFFKKNPDFVWHLDDNSKELSRMNIVPVIGISVFGNYQHKCDKLLI